LTTYLKLNRLAAQLLIESIEVAKVPFRVVVPAIVVRAGGDSLQIGL
jgi:hypothetical protein